jgi:hypothetical protein
VKIVIRLLALKIIGRSSQPVVVVPLATPEVPLVLQGASTKKDTKSMVMARSGLIFEVRRQI